MRRFQAWLLVAGLVAAPVSAVAGPSDSHDGDVSVEKFEWSVGKGRLGVMVMSLTPELQQHFGAKDAGVLVARVEADSPAAKAGVRVGDVLTRTNNQAIDDAGDVRSALASFKKGDSVAIDVVRDHKALSMKVVLADDPMPAMPSAESMFSRDWFRDFMKSFDELKHKQQQPSRTPQTKT